MTAAADARRTRLRIRLPAKALATLRSVSGDYDAWKERYRAKHALDAAPWPYFVFDNAALYRAFLSADGVDAELVVAKPLEDVHSQPSRERELLEFCEHWLPQMPARDRADDFEPVVLEVQRLAPDRPTFKLAWDGAPSTAPAASPHELHARALADVRRRLAM